MLEQKIAVTNDDFYEIITAKEDFYKVKTELEKKIDSIFIQL